MATSKKAAKKSQSTRTKARATRSSGASSRGKTSASSRSSSSRSATSRTRPSGTASKRKSTAGTARGRSAAASQVTTDHEEIREWAEQRQGSPACVKGTGGRGDTGVLRIDFPGGEEKKLQQISWDDWFDKFDERGLAFLYQESTANGRTSRFNKLVSRETAQEAKGTKTRRAGGY